MARISRQELKHDEFIDTFSSIWAWVERQHTALIVAVVVTVVALGGFAGYRIYSENLMAKADAALGKALRTYHAQILPPGTPKPATDEPVYSSEQARSEAAMKEFSELRQQYPRTRPARLADYYIALCQWSLGKTDESMKTLLELAGGRDPEASALAKMRLAALYQKQGKGAEAEKLYKELIAKPTLLVPKSVAMMALADYYRDSQPTEAAKLYEQVKKEFPDSTAFSTANDRLQELPRP